MRLHLKEVFDFPIETLYHTVAKVEEYPHFLPWCQEVHIIERSASTIVADLVIGAGFLKETYRSRVHLQSLSAIDVEYIQGPFKSLENYWRFRKISDSQTEVEFFIAIELKSKFLQKMMEKWFNYGADNLIAAFKKRVIAGNL